MPTPARTSRQEIVSAGRTIIEAEGLDGLTMQKVASIVGVRAPSLYKHLGGRGELVKMIIEAVVEDLGVALESSVGGEGPRVDLVALAHAFRDFAHRQPGGYQLIFAAIPDEWRPPPEVVLDASGAVLATTAALAGPDQALEAARMVTAWVHGFIAMELAGAFRLGGDIDRAFEYALDRLSFALATD